MLSKVPVAQLRVFEAAGRRNSLQAAAAELHLTPSAVSHAIRKMEQALGVVLFERNGRRLSLSAEGEALMRHVYRPDDPEWEERDRFLLSIGHYAIALYAALIEAGIIPEDELESYGSDDSRLPMSGMAAYTPGMEITGGSLGHGLALAVGFCLGLKRKKS